MEKNYNLTEFLCTFLALVSSISLVQPTSAATTPSAYTNFVKTRCSATTYPAVCIRTLYPYASYVQTNPLKLCKTALSVAIQGAGNTSAKVSKLASRRGYYSRMEAAALKDCMYDVKDAISELKQALGAMTRLGGADRQFQWANAKTWGSAAITDLESCLDGFAGRKISPALRANIKSFVVPPQRLISNALYLINHLYQQ
ncbi:21 kDa protein-like [Coffea arabica]|uniref:21 kDa protein-like n=1 Tax=Coffea arabica TaxID=13443 RepID=A0ABM4WBM6_COFAR|nr:pectinesterase inhibitor 4-like [Coffea arabica]